MKRLLGAGALVVLATSPAWAHGFAIYLSTPITPPLGFRWVWIVTALVLVGGNTVAVRFLGRMGWSNAVVVSLSAIGLFAGTFYAFGYFAATATTAPFPGLGPPSRIYWGFAGGRVEGLFATWNLKGVAFLVGSMLAALVVTDWGTWRKWLAWFSVFAIVATGLLASAGLGQGSVEGILVLLGLTLGVAFAVPFAVNLKTAWRYLKDRRVVGILALNVALYALCLVPYLATGAIAHGWAGGYIIGDCDARLEELGRAPARYAKAHDSKLPEGNSLDEVLSDLKPYIQEDVFSFLDAPVGTCPVESPFVKKGEPRYIWNQAFSGCPAEMLLRRMSDIPSFPIECPHHHGTGPWRTLEAFREEFKKQNTSDEN